MSRFRLAALLLIVSLLVVPSRAEPPMAVWRLERDSRDSSGNGLHLTGRGVRYGEKGARRNDRSAATFDGRTCVLEAADDRRLDPGTGPFSISAWVHTARSLDACSVTWSASSTRPVAPGSNSRSRTTSA